MPNLRIRASRNRYLRFLAVGLPAFLLAVPLNALLVETAHMSKPTAYGIVLCFQVSINFELCRRFVFPEGQQASWWKQFIPFMTSILLFRIVDWYLYTLIVIRFPELYIATQLFNVALFSLLKFSVTRFIFLHKSRTSQR